MSPSVYFAPTYFSTYYFPDLNAPAQPGPGPELPAYRDRDAYRAIVEALQQTGEFAAIVLGGCTESGDVGADRLPLAVVTPSEWSEVDDADPTVCVRQVAYTLNLIVRAEDPEQRLELLDRLTSVAQNAIDGSDLNGGCLSDLTKLRKGRYEAHPHHPEQRLTLTGTFTYLITTQTGHDTNA